MFSWLEVAIMILLAALPMSQIASILLGIVQRKAGIEIREKDQ